MEQTETVTYAELNDAAHSVANKLGIPGEWRMVSDAIRDVLGEMGETVEREPQKRKDESLHAEVAADLMLSWCLAKAWEQSRDGDITGVAQDVAASLGVPNEWPLVHDTILATLVTRGVMVDTEQEKSGVCEIAGDTVYWWENNAETCWTSEKPDWWPVLEITNV